MFHLFIHLFVCLCFCLQAKCVKERYLMKSLLRIQNHLPLLGIDHKVEFQKIESFKSILQKIEVNILQMIENISRFFRLLDFRSCVNQKIKSFDLMFRKILIFCFEVLKFDLLTPVGPPFASAVGNRTNGGSAVERNRDDQ